MTLPNDYTTYPNRAHGADHTHYPWALTKDRKPVKIDGIKVGVAIVVPLEYFMLNPSGKPFQHPGAMKTPYPDLRHYTTRDYGNRVGVFRLLKLFREQNIKVTFAANAVLLARMPQLFEAIIHDGHEIAAHGLHTDAIHWGGIDDDTERRYIDRTRSAFDQIGLGPRTWLSPARQQSFNTLERVREAGFDICLDWEMDSIPLPIQTNAGKIAAFPLLNELDDRTLLTVKHHSEALWRDQIVEAATMMAEEHSTRGSQVFGFTMTPYIAGLPFRIWAAKEILSKLNDLATLNSVSALTDRYSVL